MTSLSHKSNGSPFRLRDLKNGLFQVHVQNGPAFEGTWFAIFTIAQDLGMYGPDLEMAHEDLTQDGYDYAEFGVLGRYLYPMREPGRHAA